MIEGVVCVSIAIPRQRRSDPLLAVSLTLLKPRATKPTIVKLAQELREVTNAIALGLGVPVVGAPGTG